MRLRDELDEIIVEGLAGGVCLARLAALTGRTEILIKARVKRLKELNNVNHSIGLVLMAARDGFLYMPPRRRELLSKVYLCNVCVEEGREPFRAPDDAVGFALMKAHLLEAHGIKIGDIR